MADEAPEAVQVDFVTLRGPGWAQPAELARVGRNELVYAVRGQLVVAGLAGEKEIRQAAGSEQHCFEATPQELAALKGMQRGGVPGRTARVTLVDVYWLAETFAGAPGLDLLLARMALKSIVPLPSSLPAEEAQEPDDDDFEEAAEQEGVPATGPAEF
jgi:hypothetical protein